MTNGTLAIKQLVGIRNWHLSKVRYFVGSSDQAVVAVEDAEREVVGVLHHLPDQEPVVPDIVSLDHDLKKGASFLNGQVTSGLTRDLLY